MIVAVKGRRPWRCAYGRSLVLGDVDLPREQDEKATIHNTEAEDDDSALTTGWVAQLGSVRGLQPIEEILQRR